MPSEEDLCRRLCSYLGAAVEYGPKTGSVDVCFPDGVVLEFRSFRNVLFGVSSNYPFVGLCNITKRPFTNSFHWSADCDSVVRPAFEFSSLEELELQLSARGF